MFFKVYSYTFQKSEQIFEENKIDQDKCGAEAWGYASAGKFYIEPIIIRTVQFEIQTDP